MYLEEITFQSGSSVHRICYVVCLLCMLLLLKQLLISSIYNYRCTFVRFLSVAALNLNNCVLYTCLCNAICYYYKSKPEDVISLYTVKHIKF